MSRRREDFRGKRVVIAGGGDTAVDWALSLAEIAARVMVVHRRAKFRAAPESEARLEAAGRCRQDRSRGALSAPRARRRRRPVEGGHGGDARRRKKRLPADVLLPFFGLSMSLGPIAEWGLDLEGNQIAVDPATCATNCPASSPSAMSCTYPGKLKLILTGFAEAAIAARSAYALVHPETPLHFEYSTTSGIPVA